MAGEPEQLDWSAVEDENPTTLVDHPFSNEVVLVNGEKTEYPQKFEDLKIGNPLIENGIYEKGYNNPSPIQAVGIPLMSPENKGHIVAQAPSGSGKTAAFCVGIMLNITPGEGTQAICICHTRELSIQTLKYMRKISEFTKISTAIAIPDYDDKSSAKAEAEILEYFYTNVTNPDVIIGTPGTLLKLTKKSWQKNKIKILVLDEADEFLHQDGTLKTQAIKIKKCCPKARIFLFSATFEEEVKSFVDKFIVEKPEYTIKLQREEFHAENLLQFYIIASSEQERHNILKEIYENSSEGQTLLFCETRVQCNAIDLVLGKLGFEGKIGKLHGKLSSQERDETLKKYKQGLLFHLVVTNVLARGINIPTISLVINYTIPRVHNSQKVDVATYIHRVGRCTRWNNRGVALNIITANEVADLEVIKKKGNFDIKEMKVEEIAQIDHTIKEFQLSADTAGST